MCSRALSQTPSIPDLKNSENIREVQKMESFGGDGESDGSGTGRGHAIGTPREASQNNKSYVQRATQMVKSCKALMQSVLPRCKVPAFFDPYDVRVPQGEHYIMTKLSELVKQFFEEEFRKVRKELGLWGEHEKTHEHDSGDKSTMHPGGVRCISLQSVFSGLPIFRALFVPF